MIGLAAAFNRLRGGRNPRVGRIGKLESIALAPTFAGLGAIELRHVAGCLDEVEIPREGFALIREGRVNRTFWLIVEGRVGVTFAGRPMRSHGAGEVLGVPSLLDRKPAGVTVVTLEPVRALVASVLQFEAMRCLPSIDLRLRAAVSERLRDDYLRLVDLRRVVPA